MDAVGAGSPPRIPATNARRRVLTSISLHDQLVGQIRPALLVFTGAVALVLLIACANVANLLLARATASRARDGGPCGVGAGASAARPAAADREPVLAFTGGLLGLAARVVGRSGAQGRRPADASSSRRDRARPVGARVHGRGGRSSPGSCSASRPRCADRAFALHATLSAGGRAGIGGGRGERLRAVLVVAQVALALMLLVGSGLLVRTFARLQQVDLGFDPDERAHRAGRAARREVHERRAQCWRSSTRSRERLAAIPGVSARSGSRPTSRSPAATATSRSRSSAIRLRSQDRACPTPCRPSRRTDYFSALKIPLLAGRCSPASDGPNAPRVVVVNRELVQKALRWSESDRRAHHVRKPNRQHELAHDRRRRRQHAARGCGTRDVFPGVHAARRSRRSTYLYVVARTTGDPLAFAATLRREVAALDPTQPIADVLTWSSARRRPLRSSS